MKTKLSLSALAVILAAALSVMPAGTCVAAGRLELNAAYGAQDDAVVRNKEEVIYATLAAEGNVNAVYAVNRFEVTGAGKVTDYGNYTAAKNLTNTEQISLAGDSVSFYAKEGNFYYQGDAATKDLPWKFDVSYYLNGVRTAPKDIAGRSGSLEIRLSTAPNQSVNSAFYDHYMLQISITLDTEKCANILAPDATIASAGKNTLITYTVMPKKNADISISATVSDFAMSGIQIAGMPLSIHMDLPDTDDMTSDLDKLSGAISDLNDGVGGLVSGVAVLKDGAKGLVGGSADIQSGLNALSNNSGQLITASAQVKGALEQMASSLQGSSGQLDLSDLAALPQVLSQLSGGLKDVSDGLTDLKNGFSTAYSALSSAIQGIPGALVTQAQIDALYAGTDPGLHDTIDKLVASYSAGQTVKQTYDHVKDAFDAVGSTLSTLSGSIDTIAGSLDDMSEQMEATLSGGNFAQFGQLISGLSDLSRNYAGFHSGLVDYMGGVSDAAAGYAQFHSGLSTYADGVGELYTGAQQLKDGTAQLNKNTSGMSDSMQSQIDDLMNEYTGSDFQPISFASAKNANVSLVQFVIKCDGIEKPEEEKEAPAEQKSETLWDRFIGLFTGK